MLIYSQGESADRVSTDVVATQPVDVQWLHLFCDDLHTALIQALGANATAFNNAVYDQLKPGAFYVIVDHATATVKGKIDTQSLRWIEPECGREEVEAAVFVLDAEPTMPAERMTRIR